MKHLITMTACIMILMALLSQFVQNQKLLLQIEQGGHAVDAFCVSGNEAELRSNLSRIMDCETAEIDLKQDKSKVVISVPVKKVLATPDFWGISALKNQGKYCWEREAEDG